VPLRGEDHTTRGELTVSAGERVPFVLTWFPSNTDLPEPVDPDGSLDDTIAYWNEWADRCTFDGDHHDAVHQSLLVLKALTYEPTGGMVAAATTSLPEHIGGVRNWDYRYCWLRDATLTLLALLRAGYVDEARQWR
jgi:GH15 family glucan-1,4-alpha-glucosidase